MIEQNASLDNADLGDFLVARKLIDEAALERARRAQSNTLERLDRVFQHLGLVSEDDLYSAIADFLGLPLLSIDDMPRAPVAADRLSHGFLLANRILPVAEKNQTLIVASADPFDRSPLAAIAFSTGKHVEACVIAPSAFDKAFARIYPDAASPLDIDDDMLPGAAANDDDIQRLRDIASEAPIIRLVNQALETAVEQRASDIHIEPVEDAVRIRLRVDGLLQHYRSVPRAMLPALSSRVKILAKLNIAEHRLPQDGRASASVRGREIDLRVSCVPTQYGESIVLRLLDRHAVDMSFDALGFDADRIAQIRTFLHRPNGIILVTGPTGSGKTTTLYSGLAELSDVSRKIFSVEDPVEYELAGVSQIQVRPKIGLTFASALRSILRQDPDIIMVGEIRDLETAQIAIQASLTGHLVLSTLHTNNAAATITRLLDMGIEHYLLGSTVSAILAQRLVRRLCAHCKSAEKTSSAQATAIGIPPHLIAADHVRLWQPVGCAHCRNTGFNGRTVVSELLPMGNDLRELIARRASEAELQRMARGLGMVSLHEEGMARVLDGTTCVQEVLRASQGD